MGNRTSDKWCLYRNPGMEIWCGKITYTGSKCKRCRCTSSKSILYRMYVSDSGFVVSMVVYWLLQTKEWFPDTWLNPFIIQDNTGTVLLQFGVVILVGLALSKFFNTKTARGAMKDNKAAK